MILKEADASRPRVGAVLDASDTPGTHGKDEKVDEATQGWRVVAAYPAPWTFSDDADSQTDLQGAQS
jgi:hypothetical protein